MSDCIFTRIVEGIVRGNLGSNIKALLGISFSLMLRIQGFFLHGGISSRQYGIGQGLFVRQWQVKQGLGLIHGRLQQLGIHTMMLQIKKAMLDASVSNLFGNHGRLILVVE